MSSSLWEMLPSTSGESGAGVPCPLPDTEADEDGARLAVFTRSSQDSDFHIE